MSVYNEFIQSGAHGILSGVPHHEVHVRQAGEGRGLRRAPVHHVFYCYLLFFIAFELFWRPNWAQNALI